MRNIQIQASQFFEMLKNHDVSMWEIFSQMIDGEEKEIVFLGNENEVLFSYILPTTLDKLNEDRKIFAEEYAEKLAQKK